MKTGFIGLGQMGSQMAGNLIKAGHEVVVYNRTKEKIKPLAEKGAQAAQSVKDCEESLLGLLITPFSYKSLH